MDGPQRGSSFKTFSNFFKTWDMNPRQFFPVRLAHADTIFYTNSDSTELGL